MVVNIAHQHRVAALCREIRGRGCPFDHDDVLQSFLVGVVTNLLQLALANIRCKYFPIGVPVPEHDRHGSAARANIRDGHSRLQPEDLDELGNFSFRLCALLRNLACDGYLCVGNARQDGEKSETNCYDEVSMHDDATLLLPIRLGYYRCNASV